MTAKEMQLRNGKAQQLKVIQVDESVFFVESSEGKICYKVHVNENKSCTCADFIKNIKNDPGFMCKHILAVLNTDGHPQGEFLDRKKLKLDERFICNIQGRDFVVYAGLLDLAHQKGLMKLDVQLLQHPTKDNNYEAICRAVGESKTGEVFSDIGDANPKNVNKAIASHIIRMASTRAKARILRDFTNVGITCLEELGDLDDVIGNKAQKKSTVNKYAPVKDIKPVGIAQTDRTEVKEVNKDKTVALTDKPEIKEPVSGATSKVSEAQKRAMYNLSKRRGLSESELEGKIRETYGVPIEQLSTQDASIFIRQLQSMA